MRRLRLALRLLLRDEDPAWDRLLRRRLNRAERGLPINLTTPIPPGSMDAPLPPPEQRATEPRPLAATAAALLLFVLGGTGAALAAVDLGPPIVAVITEPAVDGMAHLFGWLVAGFLAAVLGLAVLVALAHAYAGWRILEGVNWAFVEGLAVAVAGALLTGLQVGLGPDGSLEIGLPLVGVVVAYGATIALLVAARPWFGALRLPLHPDRAPWWLRIGRGPI